MNEELMVLLGQDTKEAALAAANIIGTELARLELERLQAAEEENGDEDTYFRDMDLDEFMDGMEEDGEWNGPLGAISELAGTRDDNLVFGLKIKYAGANQPRTDGETLQEAYEIWDEGDPNKPLLLKILRIEGWFSSYEGVDWDEDEVHFVNAYDVRITKFYTAEEREEAQDDFI